jgi:predicted Zn-dependent peptidase
MAAFFGAHNLGRSILGTAASVGNLARDQMLAYFEQRYSPRNMVLAAGGNVDFDALIQQTEKYCGSWQSFDAPRSKTPATPRVVLQVLHKPQAVQQYIVQLSAGPATEDEDRYAARVLGTIIGDESGSRLFWELVDSGLAEYASLGAQEFQGAGVFVASLACAPENAAENFDRLGALLADVQKNGVTDEELERAQNKICAHLVLQAERPTNRMFSVGNSWIQRRQYKTIREAVASYRAVTQADIRAVLDKYPLIRPATVAIGPLTELAGQKTS